MTRSNNLSIYIHYPFCKSKCPYCDFNSHIAKNVDEDDFARAYLKEIDYFAKKLSNRTIKTIFFGGGTPSLMPISLIDKILAKISSIWQVDNDVEITLEANPTSFEASKFQDFRSSGINRLSIGIQSLNDKDLQFLGRNHSANEAINTIKSVSKIFNNYSFDLIYARPKQTLKDWQKELKQAIDLSANHLSLYQLTIEKGTKFYKMHQDKDFQMPKDDLAADFYDLTNNITQENHLNLYEISNYAKKDKECQHNLNYWLSGDYLGLGAGAHSRLDFDDSSKKRSYVMNYHDPKKWQNNILSQYNAIQNIGFLSKEELLEELVMMGLRLDMGMDNDIFQHHFSKKYQDLLNLKEIKKLSDLGLIDFNENNIKISKKGRILTNNIISKIL